jgi:FHA domain-containing protein
MARLFTYLVVDCPGHAQRVIMWDTLEISVGRGPDRDLVIPDGEVSRQHALFRIENQAHTIADLHTSNGTFVNGARVSRHVLRPGDVVELGPARVSFRQETESPKGKHVKFASQLKGFAPFGGEGEEAGNRTVLGLSGASGPGLVLEQGDYSDRMPTGEAQFELGESEIEAAAAVVDLDPVLDAGLEEVELSSFEDEELSALEDKPDLPPQRASAPAAAPRPAPPAPRPAPPRSAAPPAPAARAPAPPPPPPPQPVAQAPRPRAVAAAPAEPVPTDTTARATLTLEIEGPRAVLKSVLGMLLDKDIEIPPLRLRVRRPE